KDALAYLRLIGNRHDDAAFERVVNTPPRGIGDRTIDLLRARARREDTSMWEAVLAELTDSTLAGRARNALSAFLQLIDGLARDCLVAPARPADASLDEGEMGLVATGEPGAGAAGDEE